MWLEKKERKKKSLELYIKKKCQRVGIIKSTSKTIIITKNKKTFHFEKSLRKIPSSSE